MSDPARLLAGEASDFEKELLGAWGGERPSDAARARVLAIAGASGAAAGAALATKAGAAAGGSVAPKAGIVGAAIVKWLVVGAVGAAAVGASLVYLRRAHLDPQPTPVAVAPASPIAPSPIAVPPPLVGDTRAPVTAVPPVAAHGSPAASARRSAGADKATHATDDSLGEQVSALDRARRALGAGDAAGALREIDAYEAQFPHGALVEEAEVLRIESLLGENDRAAALRAGSRFLASHPASPHAARVRVLLGQTPPDR